MTMFYLVGRCTRCGGNLARREDEHGSWVVCLQCTTEDHSQFQPASRVGARPTPAQAALQDYYAVPSLERRKRAVLAFSAEGTAVDDIAALTRLHVYEVAAILRRATQPPRRRHAVATPHAA